MIEVHWHCSDIAEHNGVSVVHPDELPILDWMPGCGGCSIKVVGPAQITWTDRGTFNLDSALVARQKGE